MAFTLQPEPPFRLDLASWVLRRRIENLNDRWDGQSYRRALILGGQPVELAVTQSGNPEAPRLQVTVEGQNLGPETQPDATAALERLLGLRINLTEFEQFASQDHHLAPLMLRFRGMKPPRFPSVFECLVNAIACQQVTLTLGIRLLGRLSEAYGLKTQGQTGIAHAFPRPEDLAHLKPEDLRPLGFSRQKARAMVEAASAIAEERLDLEALAHEPDEVALERLLQLRGIGRWSAEYVLLRGLGRTHIFPGDDVGARNNLRRWLDSPEPVDYEGVQRVLAAWKPYSGLIYFHLLLDRLAEAGAIPEHDL